MSAPPARPESPGDPAEIDKIDGIDASLRALGDMTAELRDALLANDVERVRDVSTRQAEWAAAVSEKMRDGPMAGTGRSEEVRRLAERISEEMAVNRQLLEDGLAVARFGLGAMTGADDGSGVYSPDGTIRGQSRGGRPGGGAPSSGIVQRTV